MGLSVTTWNGIRICRRLVAARVYARDVALSLSPSFSLPFDLDVWSSRIQTRDDGDSIGEVGVIIASSVSRTIPSLALEVSIWRRWPPSTPSIYFETTITRICRGSSLRSNRRLPPKSPLRQQLALLLRCRRSCQVNHSLLLRPVSLLLMLI